ncbi:MAG: hypothetical protein OEV42_21310 [Deltaproteobacteria bacterium]|nr:hypothetical protein [Deltaproteobacteria bacterium]
MKKICIILALLFFYPMAGKVIAESCIIYDPPKSFDSDDIEVIKKKLTETVMAAIKRYCEDEPEGIGANIKMLAPNTLRKGDRLL